MARRTITDLGVAALKPKAARYNFADPQLPGHYIRVTPRGGKSFAVVTRDPNGKQIWATIGPTHLHTISEARELARDLIKKIKAGEDRGGPTPAEPKTDQAGRPHSRGAEGYEFAS